MLKHDIPETLWPLLSKYPQKRFTFEHDIEFCYSWSLLSKLQNDRVHDFIRQYALFVVKTEAFYSRDVHRVLMCIDESGMEILYADIFDMTNEKILSTWRYYMNKASACRLHLHFNVLSYRPAAVIVARSKCALGIGGNRYDDSDSCVEGTRFASIIKHKLRDLLGQRNFFMNFIHSSDEPADMIRELPITVGFSNYAALLENISSNCWQAAHSADVFEKKLNAAYGKIEESDLDPVRALDRLHSAVLTTDDNEYVIKMLKATKLSQHLEAWPIINHLRSNNTQYSEFDLFLVLSQYIDHLYTNRSPFFNVIGERMLL